jgi:hypothetical protein
MIKSTGTRSTKTVPDFGLAWGTTPLRREVPAADTRIVKPSDLRNYLIHISQSWLL